MTHRYSPEDDAKIRVAFVLRPKSSERAQAVAALSDRWGVTREALKARWHIVSRQDRAWRPRSHRAVADRPMTTVVADPEPAVDDLPVVQRPAWMTPITRERLMAGR